MGQARSVIQAVSYTHLTANSMNCLTEGIGMALRGNGTIPAVYSARLRLAKHTGMQIMELVERNIRPRDIMTEAAFHNVETLDMALGCSTNSMLHLPAIAHECGIELSLAFANDISRRTPNLCHLAPAGDTFMAVSYTHLDVYKRQTTYRIQKSQGESHG